MNNKRLIEKYKKKWQDYAESYPKGSSKRIKTISNYPVFCKFLKEAIAEKDAQKDLFIAKLKEEICKETLRKNEGRDMYFLELNGEECIEIIDKLNKEVFGDE